MWRASAAVFWGGLGTGWGGGIGELGIRQGGCIGLHQRRSEEEKKGCSMTCQSGLENGGL